MRRAARIIAAAAGSLALAAVASAQDVTVSAPDPSPSGRYSENALTDPAAILDQDPSVVTVPVPGGGEIYVQGPESETPVIRGPLDNWATQQMTPFSIGGAPLGPASQPK